MSNEDDLFNAQDRKAPPIDMTRWICLMNEASPSTKEEGRFWIFHRRNQHVWELFERYTFQLVNRGRTHHSARDVLHRIRWDTMVETTDIADKGLKISDHYSPYYARIFMWEYPQYRGFFEIKRLPCDGEGIANHVQNQRTHNGPTGTRPSQV